MSWYSGEQRHSRNDLTPGTMSPGGQGPLGGRPPHSQPEPDSTSPWGAWPAWGPSVQARPGTWVSADLVLPATVRSAHGERTPDSLHRGVKQVELAAALVARLDAGVRPQPLHGHRVALLEGGHFVGVLAHDQAGMVLEGRTEMVRAASGHPREPPSPPFPAASPGPGVPGARVPPAGAPGASHGASRESTCMAPGGPQGITTDRPPRELSTS